ncbi:MAG: hypothetical protein EOO05_00330 [Chitinophagaceae bacterium]|nr:MAG: hypothetical protein EOO05_00330 [Chitinophagaceae bacterium]
MASTTFSRIFSGSVASWAQILVNLLAQLIVTPIFLSYWSANEFGIWLTFQAATGFLQIFDTGHQNYVGNKFLIIGSGNRPELRETLYSAVPVALLSGFIQIGITLLVVNSGYFTSFALQYGEEASALKQLLVFQVIVWAITGSYAGLLTRSLSPFGYYSRYAWWQTFMQALVILLPTIAVIAGGHLLMAGVTMLSATILINLFLILDVIRQLKKEGMPYLPPKWVTGLRNFKLSLLLTLRSIFDIFRQQGIRIILTPSVGAKEMAAFATMRTGANVAAQGLSSITNPMLPELMKFLKMRDQKRSEASLATVWIIIVALLCPGLVFLQSIVEPLYMVWTRGKIPFDPLLFSMLSVIVLVYASSQPALAIATGNNLIKALLGISTITFILVIAGLVIFVPSFGIRGAGFALLIAECISAALAMIVAAKWLRRNQMSWPSKAYAITVTSILVSVASMLAMIYLPSAKWLVLAVSLLLLGINVRRYWKVLPDLAANKAKSLIGRYVKFAGTGA